MIRRRVCPRCKRLTEHKVVKTGEGPRQRAWNECAECQKLTPRERRKSPWGGV